MMSRKRTIDAYFGIPNPRKTRGSDPQIRDEKPECSANTTTTGSNVIETVKTTSVPSVPDGDPTRHSTHESYPFPIPYLPRALEAEIAGLPARDARVIADQPDLDLLYFDPYISRPAARQLFEFLRSELPFYRVEYDIARGGIEDAYSYTSGKLFWLRLVVPFIWTTVFGLDETARFQANNPAISGLKVDTMPFKETSKGKVVDARTGRPVPVGQPATNNTPGQKGYKAIPRPIPHCLDVLRRSAEAATGCSFNFCLVNYYASGADSISFHSDDERFLGSLPAIASFSLGARRDFLMKHKPPKSKPGESTSNTTPKPPLKIPLGSGDMVLMRGQTQANWLHSIPKRSGKNELDGGRINITFRQALVKGGTENYYQYNVGNGPVYKWNAAEMKPWTQPPSP
ncbi:DNA repair family protein [Xylaria arbuscula]|nr:DNA repair family protein [Xylaria arbuscula]